MTDKENLEEEDIRQEADEAETEEELKNDAADAAQDDESEKSDNKEEKKDGEEPEDKKAEEPEEDKDTRYMRLAADFQNFKRRVEKEKSDIYQFANEKIALDIVEVMDNFERAISHESADEQYAEGVTLIYKQLKGVLDKYNIIEIPAENQEFDPNFHNAVMTEENPDFESGFVIEAFQKGYTLNGKVIRPSMVKVAQ